MTGASSSQLPRRLDCPVTRTAESSDSLRRFLSEQRADIEAALARYLPSPPATPAVLADAIRYSVMAGGKRLRPTLTLAAADAIGGAPARALALPAACAIEMLHTYSLIHDDLPAMDDDTLRRGRATLHVVAGDGMAILAGDGLQSAAFHLLASQPISDDARVPVRKLRVIAVIAGAAGPEGMVGGQAIDLDAVRPGPARQPIALDGNGVEGMHARKTGRMIRAAAVAGAVMAGADDEVVASIDRYAAEIGLAFQIVDDLLDVEAVSAVLGKTAGKDAALGKPTYPSLFGLERSKQLASECLTRAEQHLADVGLQDSHLAGIAHWVVTRES
jgi:geranylgeranyl pyrophosphate synthase